MPRDLLADKEPVDLLANIEPISPQSSTPATDSPGGNSEPTLLPIKRVPEGQGILGGHVGIDLSKGITGAIAGIPGSINDLATRSRNAWESGNIGQMEAPAREAALLGVSAPPVAEAAAAIPRVVSESAPQVAKNLSDAIPAMAANELPEAVAPKPIARTSQMLRDSAQKHFAALDNSDVRITPQSFKNFSDSIKPNLEAYDEDFAGLTPNAEIVMNGIAKYADKGTAPSFMKLERWNQTINKSAQATTNRHDALVLGEVQDALDAYGGKLDVGDTISSSQSELEAAKNNMAKARDLWSRNAMMRRFEDIRDIAEHQDNPDLYIRQRATAITRKPALMAQYTPDQRALIVKIAQQGTLGQLGRIAPHLTPAGMVKGAIYAGAGAGMGPILPAAAAAASTAAFHASPYLRSARIRSLLGDIAGEATPDEIAAARAQSRGLGQ